MRYIEVTVSASSLSDRSLLSAVLPATRTANMSKVVFAFWVQADNKLLRQKHYRNASRGYGKNNHPALIPASLQGTRSPRIQA